jgi:hypothetical protein
MDGASDLYLSLFGPDGVSTRAAVGVLDLARGIPVEIEAIFQLLATKRQPLHKSRSGPDQSATT